MQITTTRTFTITLAEGEACNLIDALQCALTTLEETSSAFTKDTEARLCELHEALNYQVFG